MCSTDVSSSAVMVSFRNAHNNGFFEHHLCWSFLYRKIVEFSSLNENIDGLRKVFLAPGLVHAQTAIPVPGYN